jgi:glycosyltransferase involved in cell wall biosynthesis
MKILQVLGGGSWGGGAAVVLAYVSELIRRGDEVWVVCLDDGVEREFAAAGAKIVRSPLWFHPINPFDIAPFLQLWRLCRRERFALVATHTSKGGFLGRLAAKAAGCPHIVHHAHGFAFRDTQAAWVQKIYVRLERIAARACDMIISVSEEHRQAGIRERVAPAQKIVTVLNGIPVDSFARKPSNEARRALGLESNDTLIGVASRLAPKKGAGDLIEAFSAIHQAHPNTRLVLLGDGPSRGDLEQQAARSGLADRIHFIGFRDHVADLLPAFDIVVQPSISEGLSISVLEGLAAAKPVVACDITGNREVIRSRENGLLVPPSNPAALADAICLLLHRPELARSLAAAAHADCRTRFSEHRMVRQILYFYDHLAAARRSVLQEEEPICIRQS